MSTSDFIIPAAKLGNSVIAKSKKLQELRLETMHLEMENHEMEQKLNQLRLNMDKEKMERQYTNGYRWKSGQAGSLNYTGQGSLQNKENSVKALQNSSAKMKLKVLKDSLPETGKLSVVPKSSFTTSLDKPKFRGKSCGQCENKNAMLTCLECGEDYCVSCFTRIHQKGALKLHRTCPVQGKYMTIGKLDVAQQFKKDIDLSMMKQDTKKDPSNSPLLSKNNSTPGFDKSYSAESVSTVSNNPYHEKLNSGSLLSGTFNEVDSSKSFNEILMEWRNANPDHKAKQKLSDVEQGTASKEGYSFSNVGGNQSLGLSIGRTLDSVLPKPEHDFKFKVETLMGHDEDEKTKSKSSPLRAEQLVLEGQRNSTDVIIDSINGLRRMTHFDSSTQNQSMLEMCRSIDSLGSNIGELAKHLISIQNEQTYNSQLVSWAICRGIELLGIHCDFPNPPIDINGPERASLFPTSKAGLKDSSPRHASPPRRLRRSRVPNQILSSNLYNLTAGRSKRKKDKN